MYLDYAGGYFEVFCPAEATHCTDGGEIWHGGVYLGLNPPSQILQTSVQGERGTPKTTILSNLRIKTPCSHRGISLAFVNTVLHICDTRQQ